MSHQRHFSNSNNRSFSKSYSTRDNSAGRREYYDRPNSFHHSSHHHHPDPYDRNHHESRYSNGYQNSGRSGDQNGYYYGGRNERNGYQNGNYQSSYNGRNDRNGYRNRNDDRNGNGNRGGGRGGNDRGGFRRGGGGPPNVTEFELNAIQKLQIVNESDLPKEMPSKGDVTVEINGFVLDLKRAKDIWLYDLKFDGNGRNKTVDLTRQSDNDAARNLKFDALGELFKMLVEDNKTFFLQDQADLSFFVYDRSNILYSSLDLLPKNDKQIFKLDQEHLLKLQDRTYTRKYNEIHVTLQKTTMLQISGYATAEKNVRSQIQAYVNILTNQSKLTDFYVFGQKMFRKDSVIKVDRDKRYVIKEGVQKGSKAIATEDGNSVEMMLQVDAKKAAFYSGINLVQYIFECNYGWKERDIENPANWRRIIEQLRNLAVETTHLEKNRKFVVAAISKYCANECFFPLKEGGQMSVADYFESRKLRLKYPNFPCIMEAKTNKSALFPLELLRVIDGQRVPMNKMSGSLTQFMLRQCQQRPADLGSKIEREAEELELNNSNDWLKAAGIRFIKSYKFVKTQGKELPPPAIEYGNKLLQLQSSVWKLDERRHKFLEPAHIEKLAIIARDDRLADNYGNRLVTMAKQFGMKIDIWNPIRLDTEIDKHAIEKLCKNLARRNYTFLFFIADSAQLHSAIKYAEIPEHIPTQQMKIESTKQGQDTTKSIIMKLNQKAGGKNHTIVANPELKNKDGQKETIDFLQSILQNALVIGLEMSHPQKVRIEPYSTVQTYEPTCVGIAGTVDHSANSQSGGYFYQNGGTFLIGIKLSEKILDLIKQYFRRNTFYPSYIIIYRSGLSDGQFPEVEEKECDTVKASINEYYQTQELNEPKISVIAVQRKTNYRLLKPASDLEQYIGGKTPAHIQNVTPGTTITQRGTNPEVKEFIIVPQKALLGTAKPIVGTVIFESPPDSTNIEHIANLTNSLCYMHENCTSSISIPAPLKSAEQLAKRGKNNWVHWVKNNDNNNSSVATSSKQLTKEDVENFKQKTAKWYTDLSGKLQVKIETKYWA